MFELRALGFKAVTMLGEQTEAWWGLGYQGQGQTRVFHLFICSSTYPVLQYPSIHPTTHPFFYTVNAYMEDGIFTCLPLPSFFCHQSFAEKRSSTRQSKNRQVILAQNYIEGLLRQLVSIRKRNVDLVDWCSPLKKWKLCKSNAAPSVWSWDSRQGTRKYRLGVGVEKEGEKLWTKKALRPQMSVWTGCWHRHRTQENKHLCLLNNKKDFHLDNEKCPQTLVAILFKLGPICLRPWGHKHGLRGSPALESLTS